MCPSSTLAVNNVTVEWTTTTAIKVKWKPVDEAAGVSATYTVYYSPIMETRNGLQNMNESSIAQMSTTTQASSVVIGQLDPDAFYQLSVTVDLNEIPNSSSVGIGM